MTSNDEIILLFYDNTYWDWKSHVSKIYNIKYDFVYKSTIYKNKKILKYNKIIYQPECSKYDINMIFDLLQKDTHILIPLLYEDQIFTINNITNNLNFKSINHKILCGDSIENINILHDKNLFAIYMINNNLCELIPKTYYIHNNYNILNYDSIKYPCIYKQHIGHGGVGHMIATNSTQKTHYLTNYVVQEYITNGIEHTAHMYVLNGKIVLSLCYKNIDDELNSQLYIQHGPLKNVQKMDNILEYENEFNKIFIKMNYTGFACIDFKVTYDGHIKIFEINPRLGGSLIRNTNDLEYFFIKLIEHLY